MGAYYDGRESRTISNQEMSTDSEVQTLTPQGKGGNSTSPDHLHNVTGSSSCLFKLEYKDMTNSH